MTIHLGGSALLRPRVCWIVKCEGGVEINESSVSDKQDMNRVWCHGEDIYGLLQAVQVHSLGVCRQDKRRLETYGVDSNILMAESWVDRGWRAMRSL